MTVRYPALSSPQRSHCKEQRRDMVGMLQFATVGAFQALLQRHDYNLDLLGRFSLRLRDVMRTKGNETMDRVRVVVRTCTTASGFTPLLRLIPCFLTKFALGRSKKRGVALVYAASGQLKYEPANAMAILFNEDNVAFRG